MDQTAWFGVISIAVLMRTSAGKIASAGHNGKARLFWQKNDGARDRRHAWGVGVGLKLRVRVGWLPKNTWSDVKFGSFSSKNHGLMTLIPYMVFVLLP